MKEMNAYTGFIHSWACMSEASVYVNSKSYKEIKKLPFESVEDQPVTNEIQRVRSMFWRKRAGFEAERVLSEDKRVLFETRWRQCMAQWRSGNPPSIQALGMEEFYLKAKVYSGPRDAFVFWFFWSQHDIAKIQTITSPIAMPLDPNYSQTDGRFPCFHESCSKLYTSKQSRDVHSDSNHLAFRFQYRPQKFRDSS
ncbi:hypothetical protein J3R30DRAFT_734944 [Lentinula aciculospora]|uniref:C2H2-type domain-containing protein n=1 Tax=Lentinula aciculospora TaxID=153920 RepID=A0A9W9A4G8_9AGAR|nr:hypothetical protein J3R30DRAFT_734944 [Lentinula aciculospora]